MADTGITVPAVAIGYAPTSDGGAQVLFVTDDGTPTSVRVPPGGDVDAAMRATTVTVRRETNG